MGCQLEFTNGKSLHSNDFGSPAGTIPDCFASLPNLAQLYGTDNEFQGTLPSFHRQSIRVRALQWNSIDWLSFISHQQTLTVLSGHSLRQC